MNLEPAKIDGDLELVAAALLSPPALVNSAEDVMENLREAFSAASDRKLALLEQQLDQHYLQTFDYPRDEAALVALLGAGYMGAKDPWMQPFYVRFTTEGSDDVVRFMSAGPDKQRDTDDDYSALEIRRRWFGNFEALISKRLKDFTDYPATPEEFVRALDDAGIRFDALRDPWGSPLRVAITYHLNKRRIQIRSAGPERAAGARGDFTVAEFEGVYFAATSAKIGAAISSAKEFPRNADELRAVLMAAGIDFDALRDPWNHPYQVSFTAESFSDNVEIYSYSEYNGTAEQRKKVTPVARTFLALEIRSAGEDGILGTYDDFTLATFTRTLDKHEIEPDLTETLNPPSRMVAGTGTIAGTVKDQTGGLIPNVQVTLNNEYTTRADGEGRYKFTGLKPGLYSLKFRSPPFMMQAIDRVPAEVDHLTRADVVLSIGALAQTVEVAASYALVNADTSEVTAISTPRVRDYFPETLYWQPELVTDATGAASISVKLADSITTWHVAVIASTVDGRITETSADLRAFLPFMVDLDVPQVLTAGDQIALPVPVRNYLYRPQKVRVSATVPPQISLRKPVEQPGPIAAESSANATLFLGPESSVENAHVRVTGIGSAASDAIEKPVSIHPDGERREVTVNGVAQRGVPLRIEVPAGAIAGSVKAEVKFYPSLLSRLLESAETLLTRPYGCGEQTISSTYPNLHFLKALKRAHLTHERLEARALKNLLAGYQRLLGYQDDSGGFTYWGHGEPDAALTAYALSFLGDAKDLVNVDEDRMKHAREWLAQQKISDASAAALQIRALAHHGEVDGDDLDRRLGDLARKAAEFDDPYAIAAFVLAAVNAGKREVARSAVDRLRDLAQDEQGAAFWNLRAFTPFHGWGRSGQVETTALAVSALAQWRKLEGGNKTLDVQINRGVLFLLKNSDRGGAWFTSHTTVGVLDALVDVWAGVDQRKAGPVDVLVNGVRAGTVTIPGGNAVRGPITMDISRFVRSGMPNEVSFAGIGSAATQAQVNAVWYESWDKPERAKSLQLESQCGPGHVAINQAVTCEVLVSRPSFRGYGMVIAEIGLPPGAEVDRGTLSSVVNDPKSGVDSFEVAPDHVTFYIWPRGDDSRFRFVFRPRFAMKARSAQSAVYDYYNPDERVVLAPATFTVE